MRRALLLLALAAAAGCSSLGPPVQGTRTGDKIIRATEPLTLAEVARIAWGDSTLAPSVAVLALMAADEIVPEGTVLVLPARERLQTRLREARLFADPPQPVAARRPAPEVEPQPAAPARKPRDVTAMYERGVAAIAEGRADDALRDWEEAWREDPAHPGLAERLENEYRVRGLEAFSRGELELAVGLWERALEVDPTDATTLGYLRRAREQQQKSHEILNPGEPR